MKILEGDGARNWTIDERFWIILNQKIFFKKIKIGALPPFHKF